MNEHIIILGAGRLGGALALALRAAQQRVIALWNRSGERAHSVATALGLPVETGSLNSLPWARASLIVLAVSDDAIGEVGAELARLPLRPRTIVCHTAGVHGANVLTDAPGLLRASMHPLCTIPDAHTGAANLPSAAFVLEGDAAATVRLSALIQNLGGHPLMLHGDKARYHAACVMASNLMVALLEEAVLTASGLDGARQALAALAQQAITAAQQSGIDALTGPISRGDLTTIERHLQTLPATAIDAYVSLSLRALAIAEQQGLDANKATSIRQILTRHTSGKQSGGAVGKP